MKEILEFACNNEEINSVPLEVPENKQIQNAIVKAIDGCCQTTFNLNSALTTFGCKEQGYFEVPRKILKLC